MSCECQSNLKDSGDFQKWIVLRSYNMQRDEQLKIENDQRKILELINKAADFENEEYDTHFILGSNFYTSPDPQNL